MKTIFGKAAVYEGAGKPLVIREFPVSEPGKGDARLALEASGICGTDLHILKGRFGVPGPLILGHGSGRTGAAAEEGRHGDRVRGGSLRRLLLLQAR